MTVTILQLATWLTALAAAVSWGASFLPPEAGHGWAVLSFALPASLIANTFWVAAWALARRWRMTLPPLAALLLNGGYIAATFQFSLPDEGVGSEFRIATLNAYYFNHHGADRRGQTAGRVMNLAVDNNVDILCLQEYSAPRTFPEQSIRTALRERMPHFAKSPTEAIASRYPIIRHGHKRFEGSENGYMWADLQVGDDTLRVLSVHLQTTGVSALRKRFRRERHREAPVDELLVSVERNSRIRARQVGELCSIIDTTRHALILLGDFNDTPSSYTYRKITRAMSDDFRNSGSGFGGSFRPFGGVLRIDYIFSRPPLRCTYYNTLQEAVSDHRMVVAGYVFDSQL